TWDNAALLASETAAQLNVATGEIVRLEKDKRVIELPALIVAGHAPHTLSLVMGYGHRGAEGVAHGVGVNVNSFRTLSEPFQMNGVRVRDTGRTRQLAITQSETSIEERGASVLGKHEPKPSAPDANVPLAPPAASTSMAQPNADSSATNSSPTRKRKPLTLYEPPVPPTQGFGADQWAMTIDLDQCTGCSACVVACQSENNIPVVGREDVLKGREMHWLRIDRYVDFHNHELQVDVQPMLCQHCEKAPCEYVCPVNATVHSDDGLNEMVYNRCVGTRFCSNNCPYKVRRFNWFEYNGNVSEPERMQKNPQVTVRARGVMEKCTFCIQRVRQAQMDAELAGEPHTGPVQTACQQTCPTQAIVFGSLTSPNSEVARLSNDPRAFSALEELGTVPRVRYLKRVRPQQT
ncbi:MAG: 4Fe-4S dicluster domain-containing protein, partial [Gemmatimonadota bacterium]|nr:4Fe-4S dicluster domain-containing protein [Gemmatimonadota bacterium]